MNVIIKTREEAGFSYEKVVDLLHEAFQERLQQGLHYTCSSMTVERLKEKTKDGIIIVAYDEKSRELLGMAAVNLRESDSHKYTYNEYNAVSSKCKRQHLGSKIMDEVKRLSIDYGAEYILSDTSTQAESAIKYHLKNGFKIVGYESYRSTNYWSYVFRLQLKKPSKWDNAAYRKIKFIQSYVFIKLTRTINGADTALGRIYKKLKCKN